MTDIFDTKILCKKCGIEMKRGIVEKNGAQLRAVVCTKCGDKIIHPADLNCLNRFNDLKDKKFDVKLRMVGNSHTISIPKEIFEFMEEQQRVMSESRRRMRGEMDEMVRLAFEDFGRLRLDFFGDDESEGMNVGGRNSRVVKSREVRVVKNGKNLLHSKQTYDSAHPERNKNEIVRAMAGDDGEGDFEDEIEEEENEKE